MRQSPLCTLRPVDQKSSQDLCQCAAQAEKSGKTRQFLLVQTPYRVCESQLAPSPGALNGTKSSLDGARGAAGPGYRWRLGKRPFAPLTHYLDARTIRPVPG